MPIRLTKPYLGQAANTLYWGPLADENALRATGNADDQIELASDYEQSGRIVTAATANVSRNARVYNMMSSSPQTLTVPLTGWLNVGDVVTVIQWGTGAFTIAAGTGVTISTALTSLISKGQYNVAQLIKASPTSWVAVGGIGG